MRSSFVWIILLSLLLPVYAKPDCAELISPQPEVSSQVRFLSALQTTLKSAGLHDSLAQRILAEASLIKVKEGHSAKIIFNKRLSPLRLFGFASSRVLIWPTQTEFDKLNPAYVSLRMADIVGELLYQYPQNPAVLLNGPSAFFRNNIEAISTKLYLQYFTITEGKIPLAKTESVTFKIVKMVLRAFLPYEFSAIGSAKLTPKVMKLFNEGGPQAVYKYVKHVYGPAIALRYWLRHVKNATHAITLGFCFYIAPTLRDTWTLMASDSTVAYTGLSQKSVNQIFSDFKQSDADLLRSLKAHASDQEETVAIDEFTAEYREQK